MIGPFKFKPFIIPKIWGKETWTLSAQGEYVSVVSEGPLKGSDLGELIEVYMDELLGGHVFEQYGNGFPLLFKRIDAQDDLSIQVHPNDEQSLDGVGKNEMWYVLNSKPEASVILGFNQKTLAGDVRRHLQDGTITGIVNHVPVAEGDVLHIPAGMIHALCKGTHVLEVQQSSDTTYRLFDYNRRDAEGNLRQLHVDKALDVLNYKRLLQTKVDYEPLMDDIITLVADEHFVTNLLTLSRPANRDSYELDSFIVYMCAKGACVINGMHLAENETLLVPAAMTEIEIIPENEVSLLETYVP